MEKDRRKGRNLVHLVVATGIYRHFADSFL